MFHLQQNTRSYWQQIDPPATMPLAYDRHTDICVVGAGITGSLCAYMLLKHGYKVVVIDKEPFGENDTGHTSAHLSNILDEGFQHLIQMHGLENARKAFQSHTDAIALIEKIIEEENIDCDFKRLNGYLISGGHSPQALREEWDACRKIPVPDIQFLEKSPLFSDLGPAIQFPLQARFHPLKFLRGLWQVIQDMGGEIYTLTKAVHITGGDKPFVRTEHGSFIYAHDICICTNVSIHENFSLHFKEAAYRSYVVGYEVPTGQFPDLLLWDNEDPYHYVRLIPETRPGFDTVLIGGEDHRVGQEALSQKRFSDLEIWARHRLDMTTPVTYKWSGQIIEPADGLAYIGRSPGEQHIYLSCGDSGHGLTHAGVAAMIIRDLLADTPNEWSPLYSPERVHFKASARLFKENANTFFQYFDWFHIKEDFAHNTLLPGEGTLARHGLSPVALYCDENNKIHRFSAVCPHMGGIIHWNQAEKTWDCPCHGSRFAATGEVLNGPAIANLYEAPYKKSDEIQSIQSPKEIIQKKEAP